MDIFHVTVRSSHKLNEKLCGTGFEQLQSDSCVYIRKHDKSVEITTVWVDDLLLFSQTRDQMKRLKDELKGLFNITD